MAPLIAVRFTWNSRENVDYVVQANKISILVIANIPCIAMCDLHSLGTLICFGEINQPHTRVISVVNKKQGTSNDLVVFKKFRMLERGTNRF